MGEGVLIDTDVLIDYVKGLCDLPSARLYITEITLYEFIRGTKDVDKAKRTLEEGFIVLFHDNTVIATAAKIWVELKRSGEMLDDRDILIAATAIAKGLRLLTRNVRHYERLKKFGLVFFR